MAHSPCALSKAGGRPGGLLLLGQEGSEVACRGSCWPATATILRQPRGGGRVRECDSSAPLLPTPSNASAPATPFPLSPSEGAGPLHPSQPPDLGLRNLIASLLLRSCLSRNSQPPPPDCLCPLGISTDSRSLHLEKRKCAFSAFPSSFLEPTSRRHACAPPSRHLLTPTVGPLLRSPTTSLRANSVLVWPDSSLVLSPSDPLPPGLPHTRPLHWLPLPLAATSQFLGPTLLSLCPSPRCSSPLFLTLLS